MILDAIVAAKRRSHAARPRDVRVLEPPPYTMTRPLTQALQLPPSSGVVHVIAEFKRRSPSAGSLCPNGDAAAVARGYAAAGAAAVSILTDREFFGGDLADLAAARASAPLPLLRKDFVLFEEDLIDARQAGADAVLLIVRLLSDPELQLLLRKAAALHLEAVVEVHDEDECRRAVAAGATMVGVNHRDLDTLAIDLVLSARLAPLLRDVPIRIAESGLKTGADLRRMAAIGYHAVLIGEVLMRSGAPHSALEKLLTEAAQCG